MVLYNSVAGGLLCQVMYSLLLLPLGTVQPLLSHLLALLEQLNDFSRLLPETGLLEEQELRIESQKPCSGQWNFDTHRLLRKHVIDYLYNSKYRLVLQ